MSTVAPARRYISDTGVTDEKLVEKQHQYYNNNLQPSAESSSLSPHSTVHTTANSIDTCRINSDTDGYALLDQHKERKPQP